jgi:hypothetical protein
MDSTWKWSFWNVNQECNGQKALLVKTERNEFILLDFSSSNVSLQPSLAMAERVRALQTGKEVAPAS